jgi:hypothetical protein
MQLNLILQPIPRLGVIISRMLLPVSYKPLLPLTFMVIDVMWMQLLLLIPTITHLNLQGWEFS